MPHQWECYHARKTFVAKVRRLKLKRVCFLKKNKKNKKNQILQNLFVKYFISCRDPLRLDILFPLRIKVKDTGRFNIFYLTNSDGKLLGYAMHIL